MMGSFSGAPHFEVLLQRFAFGQLFSLFPVGDVVLAVSGVGALPLTRCVLVTDPDVRRIDAPVSACGCKDTFFALICCGSFK
jgi:hypothetical protein